YRGSHIGDLPYLSGKVARHDIYIVGKVLPGSCGTRHGSLASQLSFGTHLARHPRYLRREQRKGIHHAVDGIGEDQYFSSLSFLSDPPRRSSDLYRGSHIGDLPYLSGKVARHGIYIVGKILPGSSHVGYLGLASQ